MSIDIPGINPEPIEFNVDIVYPPCTCGRSATDFCEKRECDLSEEEWQAKQSEDPPTYLNRDGSDIELPPETSGPDLPD